MNLYEISVVDGKGITHKSKIYEINVDAAFKEAFIQGKIYGAEKLDDCTVQQIQTNAGVSKDTEREYLGRMVDGEILGETQTVTLKNTAKFPFNSTRDNPVTVALKQTRKNLFYTVEAEQTGATGEVGSIEISAKALNGFKIAFTGSAKSVTLQIRVKGGMT